MAKANSKMTPEMVTLVGVLVAGLVLVASVYLLRVTNTSRNVNADYTWFQR